MSELIQMKIHYCWFGKQKKNSLIEACLQSWRDHLPEYEVFEWNEENTILDCDFALQAFKLKKWAFLSDYVRLKVLAEHGGIYLDTDMLFVRSLDEMLKYKCFIGYQANGQIAAGIIGCLPHDPFIKYCLGKYKKLIFEEDRLMNMAIPKVLTEAYHSYGNKSDVMIVSCEYFYPYLFEDSLKGLDYRMSLKEQTIAVHMWNASWFTEKELAGFAFEHKKYLNGIKLLMIYFYRNPRYLISLPFAALRFLLKNNK